MPVIAAVNEAPLLARGIHREAREDVLLQEQRPRDSGIVASIPPRGRRPAARSSATKTGAIGEVGALPHRTVGTYTPLTGTASRACGFAWKLRTPDVYLHAPLMEHLARLLSLNFHGFDILALVIVALGLFAVVVSAWEWRRYRRELRWLSIVQRLADEPHGSTADFYQGLNAQVDGSTVVTNPKVPVGSLVHTRLAEVRRLKTFRCQVVLSDLSQIAQEAAETCFSHRVPKFFLAVLLVLGVGATFLKLTDTLAKADLGGAKASLPGSVPSSPDRAAALKAGAPDSYNSSIQQITGGFQSAFQASVAAIGSTAVLLFFQLILAAPAKARFFAALDNFTQFYLLPRFAMEEEHTQEEMVFTVAVKMEATISHFEALSRHLKTTLATAEQTIGGLDRFTSRFGEMIDSFSAAIGSNSTFHETIAKLYQSVSAAEGRHTAVLDQLGKALEATGQQNKLLTVNQTRLAEFQLEVRDTHTQLAKCTKDLTDAATHSVGKHQESLAKQTADISGNLLALVMKLESLIAQTGQSTITTMAEFRLEIENAHSNLTNCTKDLIDTAKNSVAEHQEVLAKQTADISFGLLSLVRKLETLVVQTGESTAAAQKVAATSYQDIQQLLTAIRELITESEASLTGLKRDIMTKVDVLSGSLGSIGQNNSTLASSITTALPHLERLGALEKLAVSVERLSGPVSTDFRSDLASIYWAVTNLQAALTHGVVEADGEEIRMSQAPHGFETSGGGPELHAATLPGPPQADDTSPPEAAPAELSQLSGGWSPKKETLTENVTVGNESTA